MEIWALERDRVEQRGGPVSLFFQVFVGCARGFPERPHAKSSLCLSNTRKWAHLAARVLLHHLDPLPALLRPLGIPGGGAVQRTQTHRSEALQRVPRFTQAAHNCTTGRSLASVWTPTFTPLPQNLSQKWWWTVYSRASMASALAQQKASCHPASSPMP
ncbi:hypothetical protein NN561_016476 [Cricetulus griseus]